MKTQQKKVEPFVLIIKNEQRSKLCCCYESKNHKKVVNDAHATSKPNKPRAKWYITTNHPRKIEKNRTQNIIPANEAENEQQTTFMIYEQIGRTFVA